VIPVEVQGSSACEVVTLILTNKTIESSNVQMTYIKKKLLEKGKKGEITFPFSSHLKKFRWYALCHLYKHFTNKLRQTDLCPEIKCK